VDRLLKATLLTINHKISDGRWGRRALLKILTFNLCGKKIKQKHVIRCFREIESWYGLSPDGKTAFIEMASA